MALWCSGSTFVELFKQHAALVSKWYESLEDLILQFCDHGVANTASNQVRFRELAHRWNFL